jgi:uncharacterized membrane protein SpoIIM required for sporulation
VTVSNPSLAEEVLPASLTDSIRQGRLWTDSSPGIRPLLSTLIMTNNIKVAILSFAGGMLLGTLTVYVLALNGLVPGAVFGYTQAFGLAGELAAFVSPHGYLEISEIFMSGGAGLQIAWAVLSPGLLRRREALGIAAQRAVLLLIGSTPLLVIAGLLEGFVSPSRLPDDLKLAIGPLTAVLLCLFLWRGGRVRAPRFGPSEPAARLQL